MGRWMEIIKRKPTESEWQSYERKQRLIVDETTPYPLLDAVDALRRAGLGKIQAKDEFPVLCKIQINSGHYIDEDLWLDSEETHDLLDELTKIRRITKRKEFITSVDGELVMKFWIDCRGIEKFEEHLDYIERMLRMAFENEYWIRIML